MLIVSKFHDYYDSALGVAGVDKSVVYTRAYRDNSEKDPPVKMENKDFPLYRGFRGSYIPEKNIHGDQIFHGVVVFCGKAYPFLMVPDLDSPKQGNIPPYRFAYGPFTTDKRLNKQLNSIGRKRIKDHFQGDYLKSIEDVDFSHLNKKYQSPVIAAFAVSRYQDNAFLTKYKMAVNPSLRDVEFYRAVNAYDAFQELYRFIDTVMVERNDPYPAPLNEKTKLASKGMDNTSFKRTEHPRKSRREKAKNPVN